MKWGLGLRAYGTLLKVKRDAPQHMQERAMPQWHLVKRCSEHFVIPAKAGIQRFLLFRPLEVTGFPLSRE